MPKYKYARSLHQKSIRQQSGRVTRQSPKQIGDLLARSRTKTVCLHLPEILNEQTGTSLSVTAIFLRNQVSMCFMGGPLNQHLNSL